MQEVVLALLAKEPSHGYELRARLQDALGPLGEAMNAGQIYVTLGRLEKAGLVAVQPVAGQADRQDRKVYALTAEGQQRVADWLAEVTWPKPAPAEFHLKLVAAAAAGLADPVGIVDAQRRALLRTLRDAQRAAMAEPAATAAGLLLEGVVLRLQADLHWLEACERYWTAAGRGGTTPWNPPAGPRPGDSVTGASAAGPGGQPPGFPGRDDS
jgi:DNA-binding PadR family transcriptional regulator